ncbi:hypothetical protein HRED_02650 [Candidatus Haloredivivus sp. G17]|jgi:hypothetical protein|nr:hypothetical protein HRED_02650 [Candidatus Haloredivivus sp. G17]
MTEKQDVNGSNWDYLIVLDACRYDIFQEEYEEFLEGKLKKVKSRGSATPEWLYETFTSRYSYNYISANPYINGQGLSLDQLVGGCEQEWNATEHFQNIVDSWINDWDEEINTVRPEKLTDTALENLEYSKTIIHYIQPHRPFISAGDAEEFGWEAKNKMEETEKTYTRKILDKTRPLWDPIYQAMPYKIQSKIKSVLGLGSDSFEKLVQKEGEEKVREYYRQDVRLALEQVQRMVKELDGKVVVTADHGELLGENGHWGHKIGLENTELLEVPWLEIKEE